MFDPNTHMTVSHLQGDSLVNPSCFKVHIKCSQTDPSMWGSYLSLCRSAPEPHTLCSQSYMEQGTLAHTLVIDSVSRQQQLQRCGEFQITLTSPWPVLSLGEKGSGLGVRLATSPRKTFACYRNTYKNESSYLSSWERRTSMKKMDDALW